MKVKLDGHTIMCPQEPKLFTIMKDLYSPSMFEDWELHYYPNGSFFCGPWIIDVDYINYTKGFKIDAKANR